MTSKLSPELATQVARPSARASQPRSPQGSALIDVTPAAGRVGFWFPVHITAKAHGLAARPGTPIGEGLWGVLEQAYMTFRNIPRGERPVQLTFYVPWHDTNQGVVALVLELRRVGGRTLFAVVSTRGERE